MEIVKFGFISLENSKQLDDIWGLCFINDDKIAYLPNYKPYFIDIYLPIDEDDRKFIANLFKDYLKKEDIEHIINRKVNYIKFIVTH